MGVLGQAASSHLTSLEGTLSPNFPELLSFAIGGTWIASHSHESWLLTLGPGHLQGDLVIHLGTWLLTWRPGQSHGDQVIYVETWSFTLEPGLSREDWVIHLDTGSLTWGPDHYVVTWSFTWKPDHS